MSKSEPKLVIVMQNTTLSAELKAVLADSEQRGEPVRVALDVAGRRIEADIQVLHGPAPVFGGPGNTTTMSLCAVEDVRLPVKEIA